ncbi:transcription initiation protein SPT3 homolog [Lethenteron reissneri]|uniref:transcription initiation protein SPT3 homolog n=1 Tax=Lethenteron reissneri TaxID=7753 RepID=UPI002AB6AE8A|nr:transcription initiation protein SPT3 homolog [Lethenteron reissneri]
MTKPKSSKRKTERVKEPESSADCKGSAGSPAPVSGLGAQQSSRPSLVSDIQSMMFAMGDVRRPLQESAALIEDVTHTQLALMLSHLHDVCAMRGGKHIGLEDILFLMRKDKGKMRRLIAHLNFRDLKSRVLQSVQEDEDFFGPEASKRQKVCADVLSVLDQTGMMSSWQMDSETEGVKQERIARAERQTREMDSATYAEFFDSRQASFARKIGKLRDWLDLSSLEVKPNAMAMETLAYLAQETVATIVELSLLVQRDMELHIMKEGFGTQRRMGVQKIGSPITPVHVREAVRRYTEQNTGGPVGLFTSAYKQFGTPFFAC